VLLCKLKPARTRAAVARSSKSVSLIFANILASFEISRIHPHLHYQPDGEKGTGKQSPAVRLLRIVNTSLYPYFVATSTKKATCMIFSQF